MKKARTRRDQYSPSFLGPRCFKDIFPYLFDAACQKNAPQVALRVA